MQKEKKNNFHCEKFDNKKQKVYVFKTKYQI